GAERPDDLPQPIDSKAGCVRRCVHDAADTGLEEVAANLAGGCLQILFAVVQAARRGIEGCVGPVRRLPGQDAEEARWEPAAPRDVLGVVFRKSVVTTEEITVEKADRVGCTLHAPSRSRCDADGHATAQLLGRLHGT